MKNFLIVILILSTQLSYAKVGDVYYCVEKFSRGVEFENFKDNDSKATEYNYNLNNFTFKWETNRIVFNKDVDNPWDNFVLEYVISYSHLPEEFTAYTRRNDPYSILTYNNGDFLYTSNYTFSAGYVFAKCSIF